MKKYIIILILTIFILSISYVNATNNETTDKQEINNTNSTLKLNNTDNTPHENNNIQKTPTKKERTFKLTKFKATLNKKQYKKLLKASKIEDYYFENGYDQYYDIGDKYKGYHVCTSGLCYHLEVKTNKYIKVKVYMGNKVKYKKTRAYMVFTYGEGQCGVPYRYMISLTHKYNNPEYDGSKVIGKKAKYFNKCKTSKSFIKLKKTKTITERKAYKKYYFANAPSNLLYTL